MPDIIVNSVVYNFNNQELNINTINADFNVRLFTEQRADGTPPSAGSINGQVVRSSGGVGIPYVIVRLYYRVTGELINQTTTDDSGFFSFSGYNETSDDYFVVAMIEQPQIFNVKGFDKITPVVP